MKQSSGRLYVLKLGALFGFVAVLILVSLTSFWLQSTFFETERFTTITTEAFAKESSRQSIGQLVADRVFEERPALKMLLANSLAGSVSTLLGTQAAQNNVERLVAEAQLLVTSPQHEPVVLHLSSVKTAILATQAITGRAGVEARLDASAIPDEVTLIDTSNLPNVHHYAVTTLWLGLATLLLALVLLVWWVTRGGKRSAVKRVQIVCIVLVGVAVLALVLNPLAEPVFVAAGRNAASQTLLRNLYEGYIASFNNQAYTLIVVSTVSLMVLTIWHRLLRYYSVKIVVSKK